MRYRPMGYSAPGTGTTPDKTVGWLWGFSFGFIVGACTIGALLTLD